VVGHGLALGGPPKSVDNGFRLAIILHLPYSFPKNLKQHPNQRIFLMRKAMFLLTVFAFVGVMWA